MRMVKDKQIRKFGVYGFLKNLRFYEPFFLMHFLSFNVTLTQIGLLYAVRETMIYVFEIPSGVFADRFGKKNELILCFLFYIASFIIFFIGESFGIFVIAMVLYGLGEALRSGTHKAMIMEYLDHETMIEKKSKVYGYTRSYSLIGSMVSSIFGAILAIVYKDLSFLFLTAIVPYLIDMLLILSYPSYMNKKYETTFSIRGFLKENVNSVKYTFKEKPLRKLVFRSAAYNAFFKTIKDYIQPIVLLIGITYVVFEGITIDENKQLYLGLFYAVIFLVSSVASRYGYVLTKHVSEKNILTGVFGLTGVVVVGLSFVLNNVFFVAVGFVLLYVLLNIRKPLMVEQIGNETEKNKRASVLSIESQITSIFIIVLAPVLGLLSDTYSIADMLFVLGIVMMALYIYQNLIKRKKVTN